MALHVGIEPAAPGSIASRSISISNYGRDALIRWLTDDGNEGEGDICGAHIPPLQRTCRRIVMIPAAELFVYLCILAAAIASGIQNGSATPTSLPWIASFEWFVLVVFSMEACLKLGAENQRKTYHYFHDPWNVFDSVILSSIIVIEVIGLGTGVIAVRLLRLMRAIRVLRAARVLPGLSIIVEVRHVHSIVVSPAIDRRP